MKRGILEEILITYDIMESALTLLRQSINAVLERPTVFIGIMLVPAIVSIPLSFVIEAIAGEPGTMSFLILLVQLIIAAVGVLASIALLCAAMNPMLTIQDAYKKSLSYFVRYVILSILVGLAVFVGFILLIVPGVIFMVWFAFAYYILIAENIGGIDAMKRSKQMVSGHWWSVFGHLVFVTACSLAVALVLGFLVGLTGMMENAVVGNIYSTIVSALIAPVFVIYFYLLYQRMKQPTYQTPPPAPETDPGTPPQQPIEPQM